MKEEASKKARVYFKAAGSVLLTNRHGKKVSVKIQQENKILALSGKVDSSVLLGARSVIEEQIRAMNKIPKGDRFNLPLPSGIERQLSFEKLEVTG